jgi:hypothetical protein
VIRFEPTDDMKLKAIQHAVSDKESCGVMFYPDRLYALGFEKPTPARFCPVRNSHPQPARHYSYNYLEMVDAVIARYGGIPSGFVQMWHTHLDDSGPSVLDFEMIAQLEQNMGLHPVWGVATSHLVLSMADGRWWSYDKMAAAHA